MAAARRPCLASMGSCTGIEHRPCSCSALTGLSKGHVTDDTLGRQ